ncbi:alpha/beta fold hydrolase [Aquimarina sp. 2-A2]|uniref:alpha/beta fold hydrolase n=1 Tax=Aquimarina sp. 2-A2 TaxID=3382644 RepID=UPI00387F3566
MSGVDQITSVKLNKVTIEGYKTSKGIILPGFNLSYQIFGKPLHTAPVVMVNHALTGNSTVCGFDGWWNDFVGSKKCIDTDRFTVLAFNIPGNGYLEGNSDIFLNYKVLTARDIASIFLKGLQILEVSELFALIGGSVGGGIAWELAVLQPDLIKNLIPIATDWKATNWLKANCTIQEQILLNSANPVHDARLHAMTLYRTPASMKAKFSKNNTESKRKYTVDSWLFHHGERLKSRFGLASYKMLNYILSSIDITKGTDDFEASVSNLTSDIHIVSINSDVFFTLEEDVETVERLRSLNKNITHHIIDSIHGHDAFLIEFEQLSACLNTIFKD